jgi:hypothetical protein
MESLVDTTADDRAFYYARKRETFSATCSQAPKSKPSDTFVSEMVSCTMKASQHLSDRSIFSSACRTQRLSLGRHHGLSLFPLE